MRHEIHIRLRRRSRLAIWWQQRRYGRATIAVSRRTSSVTLLVPYRFRRVHRWWAERGGYFWIPCPLCDRFFGGHESRNGGPINSVPDPARPNGSLTICPACTRAGRGVDIVLAFPDP